MEKFICLGKTHGINRDVHFVKSVIAFDKDDNAEEIAHNIVYAMLCNNSFNISQMSKPIIKDNGNNVCVCQIEYGKDDTCSSNIIEFCNMDSKDSIYFAYYRAFMDYKRRLIIKKK